VIGPSSFPNLKTARRQLQQSASWRVTVGEFLVMDATSAIDRAIEVFGNASDHGAEEIPWDAAPLAKPNLRPRCR
jgi:hypothetical protein